MSRHRAFALEKIWMAGGGAIVPERQSPHFGTGAPSAQLLSGCPSASAPPSSQAPTSRKYRSNAKLIRLERLRCSRRAWRSAACFNWGGKLTPVVVRMVLQVFLTDPDNVIHERITLSNSCY